MDSPWPMKCHDTRHTGRSPYSTADNPLVEIWRFKSGDCIEGGCIVDSDGMVFFGDFDGYLYAVTPDGELHWKTKLGKFGGLIWSTPALGEDGTVYVGTLDDHLFAVNGNDGEILWNFYAEGSIFSSPAIGADGTIYFGTARDFTKGDILAVNPDGTEKWRYQTDGYIFADPAIAPDGTVYIGSLDGYLYAMNPDGDLKWSFKTGDWVKSHPSIADDGTVYFSSFDGYLYALYPDGNLKWTFANPGSGCVAAVIAEDGTLYLGGDLLYAIYPNGTLKWSFTFDSRRYVGLSSPAIGADGTIFIGLDIGEDQGGELVAVNPDGSLRWRSGKITYLRIESSPCIDADGTVYVGSSYGIEDGFLHAFGEGTPNNPPDKPIITGPHQGKPNIDYDFIVSCNDPEDQKVYYFIQWGDGQSERWIGPYDSGEEVTVSHQWNEEDNYEIIVQARDYFDMPSEETTMQIIIPKSRSQFIHNLLEEWFHRYPFIRVLFDKTSQNEAAPLNSNKIEVSIDNLDLLFWRTLQVEHHIISKRMYLLSENGGIPRRFFS